MVGGLSSACLLAASPTSATAATQSLATQSLQVQPSANPQATRPVTITATGSVGIVSTITIYAQFGGASCATQAAEEATRGATLVDQRTVAPGAFSYSAAFTPAAAGTYFICTYLDGSVAGMSEHQNQAFALAVGPPPSPPSPASTTPPGVGSLPAVVKCVVPMLRRQTLGGAEHLLSLGNCKLGPVFRPSSRGLRSARRHFPRRRLSLVVVSQSPAPGTVANAGGAVGVRLGISVGPRLSRVSRTR